MIFNKPHNDCERIDRIEITCVERWKSSGLSGDEWRFSYLVRGFFKQAVVLEYSRNRLSEAISHLPYEISQMCDNGATKEWLEKRDNCCDQPGCSKEPTHWYQLKEQYSCHGEGPLPSDGLTYFRKFCEKHKRRGDCAREDADVNYKEIGKP